MKININNLTKLSKLNKNKFLLKDFKKQINLLLKNLFVININYIKPITNPLNNKYNLKIRKDRVKKPKNLKAHINNFYIIPYIL
ncbi:Aspartyl/glutamyl-tRNA(Asn/Gln) amidotransferase subunit C [Candidatus Portiera aleyrodidarum]|uniref:hypothetical protein n=1 Tax=Candidatus Portiera aleyrodidarum TaxID=91844 RepID=UPI0005D97E32|nr:hypothetical protein [Candidatus Portiera aleyrodidarum]CEL12471.1 Aspartyl/glutamyl-tRNA(Asn/Gln) amidotransferase subunit C [Candidatus Portiera aleyrodidarum]